MKKSILIISVCLLSACGGVIGNIEKYNFDATKQQLESSIDSLYKIHPEWIPPADTFYKFDGIHFYKNHSDRCYLYIKGDEQMILSYSIDNFDTTNLNKTTITLLTAAKFGQVMELAPRMSFWEKRKYQKIFDDAFIEKIERAYN